MSKEEFFERIEKMVCIAMGCDYKVEVKEIIKNNGVKLHGMMIMNKDSNVAPTIYLDEFYEAYTLGATPSCIAEQIVSVYRKETPKEQPNMEFFKDFYKVKDRICYKLINRKFNSDLLEKIPYIPFLDLAICFFYAYEGKELGTGTILIHNTHVKMWGTNIKELMRLAQKNTPIIYPYVISPMEDVIRQCMYECNIEETEWEPEALSPLPMKILCNESKVFGATCLIYPNMSEFMLNEVGSNFYVLPSSIHEGATCR